MLLATQAFAQDRFLVRVPSASIGEVAGRHGLTLVRSLEGSGRDLFVVQLPAGCDRDQAVNALAGDPAVQTMEVDRAVALPEAAPGAPLLGSTANLNALSSPTVVNYYGIAVLGAYVNQQAALTVFMNAAHTISDGAGTVAFVDTGVDFNHPVLAGSLVPGYDFTRGIPGGSEMADLDQSTTAILDQSTTSILDKSRMVAVNQSTTAILDQSTTSILDGSKLPAAFGHGTMIAGLIHLVAPKARLMPVKVFSGDGTATLSLVVAGIYYAVDHGADVINMSFSSAQGSRELMNAIEFANSRGVICVASAGNDGRATMVYPAGYRQVIVVGSTNNSGVRSSFSNYGDALVTLAAPGEGIITVYPENNYAAGWGTSFSTPLVAGGAALLLDIRNKLNDAQAEQALSQAVPIGQGLGAGELNLFTACLYEVARRGH